MLRGWTRASQLMNGDKWNEIMKISWNSLTLIIICQIYLWPCVFIAIFLLDLCLGSLELSWYGAKAILVEEVTQKYFKVSLGPLSCWIFRWFACVVTWTKSRWDLYYVGDKMLQSLRGSVDNGNHLCIEVCNPQIAYALLYCLISISYVLNVWLLGLNSNIFNLCWF